MTRSLLFFSVSLLAALAAALLFFPAGTGNAPATPFFSHKAHTAADKAAMPCQSCHSAADAGLRAGMPAASTCLDCHRHILASDPRLLPVHAAADPDSPVYTGEPVPWPRRAPLPAYVHFPHSAHVAKGYSCERCHPDPDAPAAFTMRSCLECHRQETTLPTDCTQCHR